MYEESYQKLIEAGYVSIGMDHYSKPDDEFAIALREKNYTEIFRVIVQEKQLVRYMVLGLLQYLNLILHILKISKQRPNIFKV